MKGRLTFTIIKPEAVASGATGEILARLLNSGFTLAALRMVRLKQSEAERFYAVHSGKPFFNTLIDYMASGPIVVAVLSGDDAVAHLRQRVGATDPAKAAEGSIRRDFGTDLTHNAIHASDSDENAALEMSQFFRADEIYK